MARNPSISFTEHQQALVEKLVASGRYRGVSEVVRAGLRLLEEQEERREVALKRLETAVQEGLDSGTFDPLESVDEIIAQAEAQTDRRRAG